MRARGGGVQYHTVSPFQLRIVRDGHAAATVTREEAGASARLPMMAPPGFDRSEESTGEKSRGIWQLHMTPLTHSTKEPTQKWREREPTRKKGECARKHARALLYDNDHLPGLLWLRVRLIADLVDILEASAGAL